MSIYQQTDDEKKWMQLQMETKGHNWLCACSKCLERIRIGREILKQQAREFEARRVRIEGYRRAA